MSSFRPPSPASSSSSAAPRRRVPVTATRSRQAVILLLLLAASAVVAFVGGNWTVTSVSTWYAALDKPGWTPPNQLFGPVWTLLYAAMSVAAWLVWRRGGWDRNRPAMVLYGVQLLLNLLWSGLFFGQRAPFLGLVDICLLWLILLVTTVLFFRRSRLAGWLMVPYLLWVGYATVLNHAIWQLNPAA